MAGPWERYQTRSETEEQGPWSRYQQPADSASDSAPAPAPEERNTYDLLENLAPGLSEDPRARELSDELAQAETLEDARLAQRRLEGYASGRRDVGRRGARARAAVRGAGQGAFGLGDFTATLGGWLRDGGPFSDNSLREQFAFERERRRAAANELPFSSGAGYVAGAMTGGGAIQAGVRQAAARAPGVVGQAARALQINPGGSRVLNVGRNAAGSAAASTAAAALEEGADANLGQAAAVGAVAGPVGERVLQSGMSLGRRAVRRFNPEAAATAAIARRGLDRGERVGTGGAELLAGRLARVGEDASIIEGLSPSRARILGESMSQSDEALREAIPNLDAIQARRADRLGRNIQGEAPVASVDDVRARETGRSRRDIRAEQVAQDEDIFNINRESRLARITQRRQQELAEESGQNAVRAAEERLQLRLAEAADTGSDLVSPEAITRARDQFATDVMNQLGPRRVTLDEQDATDIFGRDAVRSTLARYISALPEDQAGPLRNILEIEPDPETGALPAAELTLRQIDSLRRAFDDMGTRNPEMAFELTRVADRLAQNARTQIPAYSEFLDSYANLSRRAEGAQAGFNVRGAQPTRQRDVARIAEEQGPGFRQGQQQAAQRAVADEALRSPRRARSLAEDMRSDPRRFEEGLGPRAAAAGRAADEGLAGVEEAETALRELRRRQAADQEALVQLQQDRVFARTQEGRERIQQLQDRIEERLQPIRRAEEVVSGSTTEVIRGVNEADRIGMGDEFRNVARTRLADTAGESGRQAASVAESLARDPGLQRRLRAVFGDEQARQMFERGLIESDASDATLQAAQGVGSNLRRLAQDEQEALVSAVDLGVISTGRASGSFIANGFLRVYRLVNGDRDRAIQLTRALTSGDPEVTQRALSRLRQLGASREQQMQIANAFGAGVAMERGQAVAEPEE